MKGKNPHNALVVDTFSHIEHASGLLAALLPAEVVEHLDLSTLELSQDHWVDEKLRETETDLLYRVSTVAGGKALVYLLLEHQSTADPWMVFRLLQYMVRVWDHWRRSNDDASKLPPIIPIVLSHASGGWKSACPFIDLIDGSESLVEALRPHLPEFAPVHEDLSARSDDDLEAMTLSALSRLVMLLLKHVRDGDVVQRLPQWVDTFRGAMEGSGVDALVRGLMHIFECVEDASLEDLRFIDDAVKVQDEELLMTLAEKLRQEGRREGRKEGRKEGQRKLLLKQLQLRFGDLPTRAEARVAKATPAQLEAMAEKVLTATSLDEVFTVLG